MSITRIKIISVVYKLLQNYDWFSLSLSKTTAKCTEKEQNEALFLSI